MNIEEVKEFLNTDDDGKKLLESLTDSRVTQGIDTYKKKHEFGRIKELQDEVNKLHAERQKAQFQDIAREMGVPTSLLRYSIGTTEEETRQLAEGLISNITEKVEQERQKIVNHQLAGDPPNGGDHILDDFETQVFEKMGL